MKNLTTFFLDMNMKEVMFADNFLREIKYMTAKDTHSFLPISFCFHRNALLLVGENVFVQMDTRSYGIIKEMVKGK